jgi:hypothetical protein
MKYVITIRNPRFEEYPGGDTLEAARKEARSFMVPEYTGPIHICKYERVFDGGYVIPVRVESVRD